MNKAPIKNSIHLTSSSSLALYRSINTVAVLASYASTRGIEKALLLTDSGIQIGDLDDPDIIVTAEQELMIMKKLVKLLPEPALGLIIGQLYHMGVHGKLGIAALSSGTLLDAIKIFFQFSNLLLTYFHYDLTVKGNIVFVRMRELLDLKDVRRFVCEREVVSVYRLAKDLIGEPILLTEMRFAYPKPEYYSHYNDVFQCPVVFDASDHMMVFDSSYLFKQLPMANTLTRKIYVKECQQLSLRLKRQETMTDRVRQEILFHGDNSLNLDHLARYMNISSRTVRRHLTAEGTSYRRLVSDIRKDRAIHLLYTTNRSIEQIAADLGYSDLPNFYRAFKGWTGMTPIHYRKKALTPPD